MNGLSDSAHVLDVPAYLPLTIGLGIFNWIGTTGDLCFKGSFTFADHTLCWAFWITLGPISLNGFLSYAKV